MATEAPEIGRWYRAPSRSLFEVVAVDPLDGTIELQHFDGTIEELEPEHWLTMRAEATGAPEDWSGSVDMSAEDFPSDLEIPAVDWQFALDALDDDYLDGNDLI